MTEGVCHTWGQVTTKGSTHGAVTAWLTLSSSLCSVSVLWLGKGGMSTGVNSGHGVCTGVYSGLYAGSNYCQSHVLVDTWMLTVKLVYKLSDVPDDLKSATNTHMIPFTLTFKA